MDFFKKRIKRVFTATEIVKIAPSEATGTKGFYFSNIELEDNSGFWLKIDIDCSDENALEQVKSKILSALNN